jgi:hypothetical protein
MRIHHLRGIIGGLTLFAAGCVTSSFTPLVPYDRQWRSADSVEFLRAVPARPYEEVGIIRIRSEVGWDPALRRLMASGAERGCDAVVITGSGDQWVFDGFGQYVHDREFITAACLLWRPGNGQQPAAPTLVHNGM